MIIRFLYLKTFVSYFQDGNRLFIFIDVIFVYKIKYHRTQTEITLLLNRNLKNAFKSVNVEAAPQI